MSASDPDAILLDLIPRARSNPFLSASKIFGLEIIELIGFSFFFFFFCRIRSIRLFARR